MTALISTVQTPEWRYILKMLGKFKGKLMRIPYFQEEIFTTNRDIYSFDHKQKPLAYLIQLWTHEIDFYVNI